MYEGQTLVLDFTNLASALTNCHVMLNDGTNDIHGT